MDHELFLTWLLNTSVMGSILAVVILLFKKILNKKLGVRWHYLIWFIVLLRLLMPFSLETSFSFFNIANLINQSEFGDKYIIGEKTDSVPTTYYEDSTFKSDNQELSLNNIKNADETQTSNIVTKDTEKVENLNSGLGSIGLIINKLRNIKIGQEVYFYLWLIGAVIVGSFVIVSNLVFHLRIRKERIFKDKRLIDLVENCKKIVDIKKDIPVIITGLVSIPSVCGIIKPKILIPESMYSELDNKDLKYIILHELCHFKRKDMELNILVEIVRAMYWFNPVIWYILGKMKQDRELACDALVLTYLDRPEHNNYGRIIIKILELLNQNRVYTPILGFLRGKNQVKRRIEMIKKFSKNKYRISLGIAVLFLVVGALFLTNKLEVFNNSENSEDITDTNNTDSQDEANVTSSGNDENQEVEIVTESESDVIKNILMELDDDVEYVEGAMKWPIPGYHGISSPFGVRYHPVTGEEKLHEGIDIPSGFGEDILAAKDGKVVYSGYLSDRGNVVILNHGSGIATVYAHASELQVSEGEIVEAGTKIAEVGSTGASTGPHLHFEVRKDGVVVNPIEFLDEQEQARILEENDLEEKENDADQEVGSASESESDTIKDILMELDDDVQYVEGEMKWPVPRYNRITSAFGARHHPITKEGKLHEGIDIPAPSTTDIIAAKSGKVVYSGYLGSRGYVVVLNHGDGIATVYAQASKLLVDKGDVVEVGAKIAEVGSTGASTGPHLHFEVRKNGEPVNPAEFLDEL